MIHAKNAKKARATATLKYARKHNLKMYHDLKFQGTNYSPAFISFENRPHVQPLLPALLFGDAAACLADIISVNVVFSGHGLNDPTLLLIKKRFREVSSSRDV